LVNYDWLVVYLTILKHDGVKVNGKDDILFYEMEHNPFMFQTTNQHLLAPENSDGKPWKPTGCIANPGVKSW